MANALCDHSTVLRHTVYYGGCYIKQEYWWRSTNGGNVMETDSQSEARIWFWSAAPMGQLVDTPRTGSTFTPRTGSTYSYGSTWPADDMKTPPQPQVAHTMMMFPITFHAFSLTDSPCGMLSLGFYGAVIEIMYHSTCVCGCRWQRF